MEAPCSLPGLTAIWELQEESYTRCQGAVTTSLVNLHEHPVTIPQLAIHLDREVNDKGLILNKQEHLAALATLTADAEKGEPFSGGVDPQKGEVQGASGL